MVIIRAYYSGGLGQKRFSYVTRVMIVPGFISEVRRHRFILQIIICFISIGHHFTI